MVAIDDARKAGACQTVAGTLYSLARTLYNSAHNEAEQQKGESVMVSRKPVVDPVEQVKALIASQNAAMLALVAQLGEQKAATRTPGNPVGPIAPYDNVAWARVGEHVILAVNVNPHGVAHVYDDSLKTRVFARFRQVRGGKSGPGDPRYSTLDLGDVFFSGTIGEAQHAGPGDTKHKTTPEKLAALVLGLPVAAIAELVTVWRNDHTIGEDETE